MSDKLTPMDYKVLEQVNARVWPAQLTATELREQMEKTRQLFSPPTYTKHKCQNCEGLHVFFKSSLSIHECDDCGHRFNPPTETRPMTWKDWKPGDKLRCVDNTTYSNHRTLQLGRIYTIKSIVDHDEPYFRVDYQVDGKGRVREGGFNHNNFEWVGPAGCEAAKQSASPLPPPKSYVKPKIKVLTMADKAYWVAYDQRFINSKNTGQPLPAKKPPRKFKFYGSNPFNIKPWGK